MWVTHDRNQDAGAFRPNTGFASSPNLGAGTIRSTFLTIFWHCGCWRFSFRNIAEGASAASNRQWFWLKDSRFKGSGNADLRRKLRSSGQGGQRRCFPGDSGCLAAHPASRRAASYRPLRAVWAVCAWALRGLQTTQPRNPSALNQVKRSDPKGISR